MTAAPWKWSQYALAWLPLAAWYALSTRADGFSWQVALLATVLVIGGAAAMGGIVWLLSGRIPAAAATRSYRERAGFVVRHLALAACYAVTLVAIEGLISASSKGVPLPAYLASHSRSLTQAVVLYSWLYGVVAGVSYSVRAHQALREREVAAAQAAAQAVQAQLRALRAQLNPHFLFNSLHSLSVLVRHDPAVAEEAIEHLAEMLRYALDENAGEEVPLADEWEFVRHYLALEQLRFGDRLRLSLALEEDALDVAVPCFILQPLVENGVRHGVAPLPAGAALSISARIVGETLQVRVADGGRGADPGAVERANGLGLRALARRLEARYQATASLRIDTAPGKGFAASITVPLPAKPVLGPTAAAVL